MVSVITSKGQVTVPKQVRDAFNLKDGDRLEFVVVDDTIVVVPRNRPIESLFGRLAKYGKAGTTLGDYDDAIGEGISRHVEGSCGPILDKAGE
ncbi:AbrB/MazE/SpoVT family DNA-binding domain-containing protein [Aurantimonas sp. VKM B-3413]|uniref:AbrB/MazE/SpoVT family DNA-binding domain-containing protein n=1 Tax=Aurantimonas sp. VKM B-3413 TaxID=2779401 RepID=UPI001E644A71|nr:AbrB/MazE/SpoVT family DNA-binding domain-containing protein [Aurantimonas sp. VKM B-3413]MCB8839265.1 AbrB/MazE/SpoVT family DNA-binding domain-containing protein [Aurantimonas sp. VKM B-3413]